MTVIVLDEQELKAYRVERRLTAYFKSLSQPVIFSGIRDDYAIAYGLQNDLGRRLYGGSFRVNAEQEERKISGAVKAKYFIEGEAQDILSAGTKIIRLKERATLNGLSEGKIKFVPEGAVFGISHGFSRLKELGDFFKKLEQLEKDAKDIFG